MLKIGEFSKLSKEENVEIIAWMTVSGSYNDTEQFDDITTLCFRYLGK